MLRDLLPHEHQLHVGVGERDLELQPTRRRLDRIDLLGQPQLDLCRSLTLMFSRELDLWRECRSALRGLHLKASQIGVVRATECGLWRGRGGDRRRVVLGSPRLSPGGDLARRRTRVKD
jgi:hypothetical protein